MALDPSIALGIRPLEVPNQLAQYAQMAQVENAQQQNALAQFQLGAARRAEQGQNALGQAYGAYYGGGGSMGGGVAPGAADLTAAYGMGGAPGAARGGINYDNMRQAIVDKLRTTAPNLIPVELARINEMEQKGLLARKTQTDIETAGLTQQKSRQELATIRTAQFRDQLSKVNSPEAAAQWTIAMYNDPHLKDTISSVPLETALAEIPKTPDAFNVWKNQNALGMAEFIRLNKPTTFAQDTGPGGRVMSFPGLGGPATLVPGSEFTKSMTFADRNAAARLAFDKSKFEFEKANPTMSIQEDPSGLLAINTRTGVATPVVYGPMGIQAAPAAAPGASMMRQPPAALPGQRAQVIPGMTSVLDQTAAPAAMPMPAEVGARMPGMPVGGKKEAPAKFNDTDMQLAGLAGSLKDFKEEVGKNLFTGAKFVPSGQDTARMTAKYTALLMGVKDLYTLGALTGPDMSIIESQLTNPASWSGKFTSKKGFDEQIKVIEDMLKRTTTNLENTYGRVPKASKRALEGLPGGAAGGISGATANDPLGLGIR